MTTYPTKKEKFFPIREGLGTRSSSPAAPAGSLQLTVAHYENPTRPLSLLGDSRTGCLT